MEIFLFGGRNWHCHSRLPSQSTMEYFARESTMLAPQSAVIGHQTPAARFGLPIYSSHCMNNLFRTFYELVLLSPLRVASDMV